MDSKKWKATVALSALSLATIGLVAPNVVMAQGNASFTPAWAVFQAGTKHASAGLAILASDAYGIDPLNGNVMESTTINATDNPWTDVAGSPSLDSIAVNSVTNQVYGASGSNQLSWYTPASSSWSSLSTGSVKPDSVTVSPQGDVYVVDSVTNQVYGISSSSTVTNTVYGTTPTITQLGTFPNGVTPTAIFSPNTGMVLAIGNRDSVYLYDKSKWSNLTAGATFSNLGSITADPSENIFVSDGNTVWRLNLYVRGSTWYPIGSTSQGQVDEPTALADAKGILLVVNNASATYLSALNPAYLALSGLSVNQGALSPAFSSLTGNYTDTVPSSVDQIGITPSAFTPYSQLTIDGQSVPNGTQTNIPLSIGDNVITIGVTSQQGVNDSYTIDVTRLGAAPPPVMTPPQVSVSQGTVGSTVQVAYASNPAWVGAVQAVFVNGTELSPSQYAFSNNQLWIRANAFPSSGNYTISIQASGYTNSTFTAQVTAAPVQNPNPPSSQSPAPSSSGNPAPSSPPTKGSAGTNSTIPVMSTMIPGHTIHLSASQLTGTVAWSLLDGQLASSLSFHQNGTITGQLKPMRPDIITVKGIGAKGKSVTQQIVIDSIGKVKKEMVWQGPKGLAAENVPFKTNHGLTYLPIFYVQQLLKSYKIMSHWNGHTWSVTTSVYGSGTTGVPSSSQKLLQGIYVNGRRLEIPPKLVTMDVDSHKLTTFMPIQSIQILLSNLGIKNSWDGRSFVVGTAFPTDSHSSPLG